MNLPFKQYGEEEHILIRDIVLKDNYPIETIKCTKCGCTLETKRKEWLNRLWFARQHKECKGITR